MHAVRTNRIRCWAAQEKNVKRIYSLVLLLIVTSVLSPAMVFAERSDNYGDMGAATWSAFSCAVLASKAQSETEQKRLFSFALDQGRKFITAVEKKKVARPELSEKVPLVVLMLLEGPSTDFMLGRIYAAAEDSALKNIRRTDGKLNSQEIQAMAAMDEFRASNCHLLGKK